MRFLITTGPTQERLDDVRFLTNASSGRMGAAVASAAASAGHDVTLLAGPVCENVLAPLRKLPCRIVHFQTVDDLRQRLNEEFPACDVLVMAAAVGDFRPESTRPGKLARSAGPVTLKLLPTPDLLAGLKPARRDGQFVVAFAVEAGPPEECLAKASSERKTKSADLVVVNTPAAMGAVESDSAILDEAGPALEWGRRSKTDLAHRIVQLLEQRFPPANPH